jgi:hypothetical protein
MIIYVSGRYSAPTKLGILENIMTAEFAAIKVWERGHVAICPHLNTRFFEEKTDLTPEEYINGDLNILERCDAILMLGNWRDSHGAKIEHDFAKVENIRIFYHIEDIPIREGYERKVRGPKPIPQ